MVKSYFWNALLQNIAIFTIMSSQFTIASSIFVTSQKLKKQNFEAQSLNHSGKDQFDPVLAKQGGGAKD